MLQVVKNDPTQNPSPSAFSPGRWVTESVYAERFGLARQTLTNWRHKDLQEGRQTAREGYPVYRRFGRAVRYWMED